RAHPGHVEDRLAHGFGARSHDVEDAAREVRRVLRRELDEGPQGLGRRLGELSDRNRLREQPGEGIRESLSVARRRRSAQQGLGELWITRALRELPLRPGERETQSTTALRGVRQDATSLRPR